MPKEQTQSTKTFTRKIKVRWLEELKKEVTNIIFAFPVDEQIEIINTIKNEQDQDFQNELIEFEVYNDLQNMLDEILIKLENEK